MRNNLALLLALLPLCVTEVNSQSVGQLLWVFDPYLMHRATEPALADDGTIYYGVGSVPSDYYCRLFAINPDGAKKWEFQVQDPPNCPSIAANGTIYVGTKSRKLFAINPDGTKKWEFNTDLVSPYGDIPTIVSCPAMAADGTLFFGANIANNNYNFRASRFYALNPDGTEKWRYNSTNVIFSPAIIGRDGTVYFKMQNYGYNGFLAFSPSGRKLWDCPFAYSGNVLSIGGDGIIYVGGFYTITAVHPDGIRLWDFYADAFIPMHTFSLSDGILALGDRVYLVSRDGYLLWSCAQNAGGFHSDGESYGALIGLDGTIYFGANSGRFSALNANGSIKWQFETNDTFNISPVMSPKGIIYATTKQGKLFAFRGSCGPANTPWPMFQRDAKHSGRAYDIATVPPWLNGVRATVDRGFLYTLTGELEKTYTIQASTNLVNWTTITNVTFSNNPTLHFMDTSATNFPQRFYRSILN